ncbi:hypothetical protein UlMin_033560 [Ulmus minor]
MGVLGLLLFAVKVFLHFLAWPLLALGYPLCASIKSIEANSVSNTQKLNSYWVVLSLVLLFEHAFVMFLQRFPFWPYLRLMIVCWLVIPDFDGASYVYKHLIRSVLSLEPQIVINWFNKRMESSFKRQKLLAEVERFVKENGTEALEKLIASKPGGTKNLKVEDIKAVSCIEKEAVDKVSQEEPNLIRTENRIVATGKTKETVAEIAAGRDVVPQTSASKPLQKEWTCNICNVETHNEKDFNSHLQGKMHKNKGNTESVKAEINEIKAIPFVENIVMNQVSRVEPNIVQTENQVSSTVETTETVAEVAPGTGRELHQREWTCSICHVTVHCESDFNSHLQGKRHKKIVVVEAMKATNQTVIPETVPSYTMKKSESPNEESGNSTKSQTNLLEIVPSNISKKSDDNSAKNQMVQPNVVVSYIPKQSYQLPEASASGSGWNIPMIPRELSGWEVPMIPQKASGWDTPMFPHQASGFDVSMFPREASGWDIPIFRDDASGWDKPMFPYQASGWDIPMFPHEASSAWNVPLIPYEMWQGKKNNIWASSSATKPGKLEKVEGSQWCSLCKVRCSRKLDMDSHLRGKKHLNRVQLSGGV